MEFTRHYLPLEWEERWRREKEMHKRAIEDGDVEGIERANRELRRIVAYNDSRMGLTGSGNRKTGATEEGTGMSVNKEAVEHEELAQIYFSGTYPKEVFLVFKEFWESSVFTDLTLVTTDEKSFQVHSTILAAVSSFIQDILREESNNDVQMRTVSLGPDVHHIGLKGVVEFAYTGCVLSLNKDNMILIRAAAQAMGVPRLLQLCDKQETSNEEQNGLSVEQMKITAEAIQHMWTDRVGCDVTLDMDGASFHVHKVVLAASSDYFRGMFTSGMRESRQTRIALPFLLASEFDALIGCSYSGMLLLSWDCVFEITCMALPLQLQPGLSLCLKFMRQEMGVGSCLDVASFAEAYGMSELLADANDFVLRNFWEVSDTAKFRDLPGEKLLDIIRCDGLCVPTELAVFRAVSSWIETEPDERLGQASVLMTGVRFPLMTFREFREVRAINLRMECYGNKEVELYGSALKEFGFSVPKTQPYRVRHPNDVLVVVGGDQMNPDAGHRIASRELWFANSILSCTGLMKELEWRCLGEMPDKPRFRHGVATMNGRLYVIGGCFFYTKEDIMKSAYSYDPVQNIWKRLADMLEFRSNFSVVAHKERLYAIGGDTEINTNIRSVEMYDPVTNCWSFVHPVHQPLSGHAATATDGCIFVSGGFNSKYECLPSMFLYHPESGSTYLADMANDRALHCMEPLRGHLYVAGGVCNLRKFYTDQQSCEVYDPVADSWTIFASLSIPHVGAASAVLEEKIYILGGYCQDDYSESGLVDRFEPRMQRWQNMGKLPRAVTDIRACVLHLPQQLRF